MRASRVRPEAVRQAGALRAALKIHADYACPAVEGIEAEAVRTGTGELLLRYVVAGRIGDLRLPSPDIPGRADRLWEHSCFEAFVRAPGDGGYYEFNFAPSGLWAAYRFAGHRSGMRDAVGLEAPQVQAEAACDAYEMRVKLATGGLPGLGAAAVWEVNLSAILEERPAGQGDGRKSYWALAHPAGKADFHDPDCFVLQLPPAA